MENEPDDTGVPKIIAHLLVRDKDTKEILVNQRDKQDFIDDNVG